MNELLRPILSAAAACTGERVLITVDGPCGCGKTTLAALLAELLQAQTIHTDDYVVPHARKTPERLAKPGGNEDHERLLEEIVLPWKRGLIPVCRPYLCGERAFGEPVPLQPGRILILEGSYSNMPQIRRQADVRVFITISPEAQLKRLQQRESEASMRMFLSRWIPLQNAYHQAFALPDSGCIVLDSADLDTKGDAEP